MAHSHNIYGKFMIGFVVYVGNLSDSILFIICIVMKLCIDKHKKTGYDP